ncbi:hypothetical protein J6590_052355 [Homalodisca vitripennis]|nr:hypothetical protein J6590_052355 [Homalodisca vitripennis]
MLQVPVSTEEQQAIVNMTVSMLENVNETTESDQRNVLTTTNTNCLISYSKSITNIAEVELMKNCFLLNLSQVLQEVGTTAPHGSPGHPLATVVALRGPSDHFLLNYSRLLGRFVFFTFLAHLIRDKLYFCVHFWHAEKSLMNEHLNVGEERGSGAARLSVGQIPLGRNYFCR